MTSSPSTEEQKTGMPATFAAKSIADRIILDRTCFACPEQYDAKLDGAQVGYLRLRHGYFRVDYPDCGETTILEGYPKGDGIFEPDERAMWLDAAKLAIANAVLGVPGAMKAEG